MCVPENSSRPASVPSGRAQQAARPYAEKALPFRQVKPIDILSKVLYNIFDYHPCKTGPKGAVLL